MIDWVEFDLVALSDRILELTDRVASLESFVEEVASDVRPPQVPIRQIGDAS